MLVVEHVVFRLHNFRLIADLFRPPSQTVFEVKTTAKKFRPDFLAGMGTYLQLREEGLAENIVYGW